MFFEKTLQIQTIWCLKDHSYSCHFTSKTIPVKKWGTQCKLSIYVKLLKCPVTSENSSPFSILTHQWLNAQIERNKMHREENYLLVTATPLMLDAEATYELKRRSRRKTKEKYSIREAAMLNTRVLCLGDWVSLVSELDRGKLVICFPAKWASPLYIYVTDIFASISYGRPTTRPTSLSRKVCLGRVPFFDFSLKNESQFCFCEVM